jgi:hypothetical protein
MSQVIWELSVKYDFATHLYLTDTIFHSMRFGFSGGKISQETPPMDTRACYHSQLRSATTH